MVLKTVPQVYGKHLTEEIGKPQDYSKNRRASSFHLLSDEQIKIPAPAARISEDEEVTQLIEQMALQEEEEVKIGVARELPHNAYMPVKALNPFSSDWVIKVRVVKKGDLRTYSNHNGEGKLINFDLVDV